MNPTVGALMLTSDRHELAKKAVQCFRAQTYDNKSLLVLDTGLDNLEMDHLANEDWQRHPQFHPEPIGSLRNAAMFWTHADIVVHWDDDDWSHPNRIAEQVALLQSSGADVVGYNEMLFWREPRIVTLQKADEPTLIADDGFGEAWLYSNTKPPAYALGTSLCFWRKTWERHQFAHETQGVEDHWLREKKLVSVTSLGGDVRAQDGSYCLQMGNAQPRMVARIHGGNTSNGYKLEEYVSRGSKEWQRVPEWDDKVRGILG
jgi:glycosyltransferase involved in cell wall biosynthesis